MVKERRPNFVFLMETLCQRKYMECLRYRLGFDNIFVVDPVGRSGGLALLWRTKENLEIYNYSRRHIHAVVKDDEGHPVWKLTGFYGHPDSSKRSESWDILRFLSSCQPYPWICVGDFNEIVDQEEKEGSLLRRESRMIGFREALEACHLGDLGFIGSQFTWSNRRSDDYFTRERLDRAVANSEWCNIFPRVSVLVLAARTSDHSPLIVSSHGRLIGRTPYRRSFKFEALWGEEAECAEIINLAWNEDDTERGSIAGI
jgi:hypothetical protein